MFKLALGRRCALGRRSDHSREEIREMALKAARTLVEKKGYQGLTARKVAKEIGYTVGTLYLVFENLDDLIVALNTETVTELRLELEHRARACQTERGRIPALAEAVARNHGGRFIAHPTEDGAVVGLRFPLQG